MRLRALVLVSLLGPPLVSDQQRHPPRQRGVEVAQGSRERCARRRASQLGVGLVRERLQGAAKSSSTDAPWACADRKPSLLVFSSSLRTRYAMPATRSPTGQ